MTAWHGRLLIFAQSMDAATFLLFFAMVPAMSIHAEQNPIIRGIVYIFGFLGAVALVKIGLACIVAYRSTHSKIKLVRFHKLGMSTAIASGIVGAGFNLAAIWRYA